MHLSTWWAFCLATFCICGTPGPNMLHVMTSSIRHGFRRSFFSMAGCISAVIIIIAISAAGVGAMLKASSALFWFLRCAGAGYLVYLGIRSMLAPTQPMMDSEIVPEKLLSFKPMKLFRNAFCVASSNPKLLLFATAFFPLFITPAEPQTGQILLLFFTFIAIELGWYMVYGLSGSRIARHLRNQRIQKLFNRATGALFVAFGISMLALQPE